MKIKKSFARGVAALVATLMAGGTLSAAISNPDWMTQLPDEAYVANLSIPGAHDAITNQLTSLATFSTTQSINIEEMMTWGVRAFDFRPAVDGSQLNLRHGSAKSSRYMEEALKSFCSFLESHPDEFFIIHLYKAGDNNNNITTLMNQYLADASIAPHVAEFRPDIKVKDMRGKILFLKRDEVTWDNSSVYGKLKWWKEEGVNLDNPDSYLSRSDDSKECYLWVQDKAKTDANSKKTLVLKGLERSMALPVGPSRHDFSWVINFTSAYNGVTSTSSSYKSISQTVNPAIVDYLNSHNGPTGILLSDYVTESLIQAVIDNNFTYISDYTPTSPLPEWYENGVASAHGLSGNFHGNVEWADLTANGHYELFVKGRDIQNGWDTTINSVSNDGSQLSGKTQHENVGGASWERILVPCDVNNDGALDMIYGCSWDSKLRVNDGNGNLVAMTNGEGNDPFNLWGQDLHLDGDYTERRYQGLMFTADFDMNGYQDIITFNRDGGVPTIFYNHQASGSFYGVDHNLPALSDGVMAIADLNRDGIPDVVVSGKDTNGTKRVAVCIKRNEGEGNFTFDVFYPEALQAYATTNGALCLGDLTNDGNIDLFIAGEDPSGNASANIFHNTGNLSFTRVDAQLTPTTVGGADMLDIDSDGNLDIVYAGWTPRWEGTTTSVVMNQGDGRYFSDGFSLRGKRSGAAIRACDYNHNGHAAVAVMGYPSTGNCTEVYEQVLPRERNGVQALTATNGYSVPEVSFSRDWEAEKADGKLHLTWEPIEDGVSYRYNYIAVTKSGQIYSAVPCNPEKGVQLTSAASAATTGTSATLNINPDNVAKWGVYAIAPNGMTGNITTAQNVTGIDAVSVENVSSGAEVEYFNLQGVRVNNPQGGIFIERRGSAVAKVRIP